MRFHAWWLTGGWLLVALIVVLGLVPTSGVSTFSFADKIAHFSEFFIAMAWFGGIYTGGRQWLAFGGLALLGLAIELFQGLQIYRTFDLADLTANLVGLLAGLASVRTWLRQWCARIEAALT